MQEDARRVLGRLLALRGQVEEDGRRLFEAWEKAITRPSFRISARNLANYMALRRHDLSELQWELIPLGLSSLGRLEARVMPTLDAVVAACDGLAEVDRPIPRPSKEALTQGEAILEDNSALTLGPEPQDRYTRIMVTLPSEAGRDPSIIDELVAHGMEVARINCSHDDENVWLGMINFIRSAAQRQARPTASANTSTPPAMASQMRRYRRRESGPSQDISLAAWRTHSPRRAP